MNSEQFREFSAVTIEAVNERDVDKLILLLTERNRKLGFEANDKTKISVDDWLVCADYETRLHARLLDEKKKVLKEMEALSQTRQAVQKYSPEPPFPRMPVFFDIEA